MRRLVTIAAVLLLATTGCGDTSTEETAAPATSVAVSETPATIVAPPTTPAPTTTLAPSTTTTEPPTTSTPPPEGGVLLRYDFDSTEVLEYATEMIVSQIHNNFVHVPLEMTVSKKNQINPDKELWRDVVTVTGQPRLMKN